MKFQLFILLALIISITSQGFAQDALSKAEKKLIRKNKRIEKRYVHPKSVFFQYTAGFNVNKLRFSEESEHFERNLRYLTFFNYSIEIEIGTKNDFFYEIGSSLREYKYGYSYKPFAFYEAHPTYFGVFNIFGGYGKRIILKKNNLNIINIQIGASISINFNPIIEIPDYTDEHLVYHGNSDYTVKQDRSIHNNRVFPTLYIGLTKDIRFSRRFYLTLNYRYDQGIISTYKQRFEIYKNSNPNEITTIYNHFRGTAHSFSIGLKHRFLAKKYKEKKNVDDKM